MSLLRHRILYLFSSVLLSPSMLHADLLVQLPTTVSAAAIGAPRFINMEDQGPITATAASDGATATATIFGDFQAFGNSASGYYIFNGTASAAGNPVGGDIPNSAANAVYDVQISGGPFGADFTNFRTSGAASGGLLNSGFLRFQSFVSAQANVDFNGVQSRDTAFATGSVFWSYNGAPLPGQPETPLLPPTIAPDPDAEDKFDEETIAIPVPISGTLLTGKRTVSLPLGGPEGFGTDSFIYIDPDPVNSFLFQTSDINFREIIVPPLPNGDTEVEVAFDGQRFPLSTNTVFDFTAHAAAGVDSFVLLGIDDSEMVTDGIDVGFKWMGEGDTIWNAHGFRATAVPEPSSFLFLSCLGLMLVTRQAFINPRQV